jgi:hypothetical protein
MGVPENAEVPEMARDASLIDTRFDQDAVVGPNPHSHILGPGSHPVEVGIGAILAGSIAAAAAGSLAGPIGAFVGAMTGAIAGGYGGKAVADLTEPLPATGEWRDGYTSRTRAHSVQDPDETVESFETPDAVSANTAGRSEAVESVRNRAEDAAWRFGDTKHAPGEQRDTLGQAKRDAVEGGGSFPTC